MSYHLQEHLPKVSPGRPSNADCPPAASTPPSQPPCQPLTLPSLPPPHQSCCAHLVSLQWRQPLRQVPNGPLSQTRRTEAQERNRIQGNLKTVKERGRGDTQRDTQREAQ